MSTSAGGVYPGPRPFGRTDDGRFFGRTAEAAYLGERWAQNPLTFLSGPSGIGKTSLLTAGVLPLVEGGNVSVLPVGRLSCGARSPVAALRAHNPFTLALLRSWSAAEHATDLAGSTVDQFIRQHAERRDRSVSILAAIDQADDLFAGPVPQQRSIRLFLDELAAALHEQPTLHVLIVTREDALSRLTGVLGPGVQYQLGPLGVAAARQAAEGARFFEPEAASELVDRIRTSRIVPRSGPDRIVVSEDVEPALLQIACARLWDLLRPRPGAGAITAREMRRRGDVDAALAGYCSEAIAAVAAAHEIPVAWLRYWLIDPFITEVGERDSAGEGPAGTAGQPRTVARALEDRYLLRARGAQGAQGAQPGPPPGERRYQLIGDRVIEPVRRAPDREAVREDPDAYLKAAERALITGELTLAGKYARMVLEHAPGTALRWHAEARSLLGNLAYQQGQLDEAEEHYHAAAKLSEVISDRAAVVRLLAAISRTLIDRGRFAEALAQLSAALNRATAEAAAVQFELTWVMTELAQRSSDGPRFQGPPQSPSPPDEPRWEISSG